MEPLKSTAATPRWLTFLAWMEMLGGAVGLITYLVAVIAYPRLFPVWHHLLAVAFFGTNVVAGFLLREGRPAGTTLSFIVQLLQVLFLSLGTALIARAGIHLTVLIASTGAGIFFGPASEFTAYPVNVVAFAPGAGLGFTLKLGFFLKPLAEARFAFGVNLVALYFVMRLWGHLSTAPTPAPAQQPAPPARSGPARWALPGMLGAIGLIAAFLVLGGPQMANPPHPRWIASTGDTLEVLKYMIEYQGTVDVVHKSVGGDRVLLVQFRSDLRDTARDRANSAAVAQLTCRVADSLGANRILVQPSQKRWMGVVTLSRSYWFPVDSVTPCTGTS